MSDLSLTKIRLRNGVWEGRITGAADTGARPEIRISHQDQPLSDATCTEGDAPGTWELKIPLPKHVLAEGAQTILIEDAVNNTKLGEIALLIGDIATDDLRAEVELLRAELDMLKRAFRRHCLETM